MVDREKGYFWWKGLGIVTRYGLEDGGEKIGKVEIRIVKEVVERVDDYEKPCVDLRLVSIV